MKELLTVSQTREADAASIARGLAGRILMERAGAGVAEAASDMTKSGDAILVACGPGNNGGDGFVAARLLATRGRRVVVALVGDREALRGDAASAAADWTGPLAALPSVTVSDFALVIDAIFGAGLTRAPEGEAAAFIEALNESLTPVLAVDLPSGLDGDTGQPQEPTVRAAATVTFARRKPGHVLMPGRDLCGPVALIDIGISNDVVASLRPTLCVNHPDLWRRAFPILRTDIHKYTRGHVLVMSGGAARTGAARLAARGALRIGAGLVTVASPPDALAENAAHLTSVMLRMCASVDDLTSILADRRWKAVAMGPGLGVGEASRALVSAAAASSPGVVLDADGITSFAGDAGALAAILATLEGRAVLTPHEGEFARLFPCSPDITEPASKVERTRRAAEFLNGVIVLKGPDTVIAAPDGRAAINETGTPYLATAGSGDVLTGFLAGLIGQGMPTFEAAAAAVWLHGECGRRFGPGLIAEDLPELLPAVLRDLANGAI